MAKESLGQKVENMQKAVESLQKAVESLQHKNERLQAINEIQNLVGKYEVLHDPKTIHRSWELFALKQPDVSVEIAMWGVFVGAESIKKLYEEGHGEPVAGTMFEHDLTTPIIEVAEDCQTAKGLWFSPGHETPLGEDGKPVAKWSWGKFGADFIKEDGEWKIWHYHWYDTFMCPFDKSWVDTPQPAIGVTSETEAGFKPDKPTTTRSTYFPTKMREPMPWYPEPYKTWDGKSMA
jgi:hypothetical protein